MALYRLAAFSDGEQGGNPAGVFIAPSLPTPAKMQEIARNVGYSETAFAAPDEQGWTVRYYAPEGEVAFCGHATIALGAQLARLYGTGTFDLALSKARISVSANGDRAALVSPPTRSAPLGKDLQARLMQLFQLTPDDLDRRLAPSLANAGVDHAIFALKERSRLAEMAYDFNALQALMVSEQIVTVSLLWIERSDLIHARNAFAYGGVVEDPATGAAAAALAGLLVDQGWPLPGGRFTILQGADMGAPSRIEVQVTGNPGAPVTVSGTVREIP